MYSCLQVGDASANVALSLVGYEKDVEAAMSYVFGSSFICDTQEHAKAVSECLLWKIIPLQYLRFYATKFVPFIL